MDAPSDSGNARQLYTVFRDTAGFASDLVGRREGVINTLQALRGGLQELADSLTD